MAERNFDYLETLGRKKRVICGSFRPEGAGAIDNTLNTGKGFTVAYTAAGRYTVTFDDKFGPAVFASAMLCQATRSQAVEVESISPSTPSMVIHASALGGAAWSNEDITEAAGTYVYFMAVFDDALDR